MTETWPTRKLRDVADIRVSNVDKKVYASETPIKLCNYMDVYSNDYVTREFDFMPGSASKVEMERFGLLRGDVIITKDSETPDDIGKPAVVMDDILNLVCGYHLCLIRPKNGDVDSVYLAKQLGTSRVVRYFSVNASGSTRFGLPVGAIENLDIPFAPEPEQAKIAEILSTVDRAIEQTEALIAKQQRIKTGLMQDLLTRGIDQHGNLRSEETHQFKDSPLGRIPVEWVVAPCGAICTEIVVGIVIRPTQYYREDGVAMLRSANVKENRIDPSDLVYMSEKDNDILRKSQVRCGDLVTVRTGYPGTTAVIPAAFDGCNCVDIVISRPNPKKVRNHFLAIWVNSDHGKRQVLEGQGGLAQQHFNVGEMKTLLVKVPDLEEQLRIEHTLAAHYRTSSQSKTELAKLRALKTALMRDLLTGEKRVTPLLDPAVTT
jgi:type I restriction enzyme, S subunit